MSVNESMADEPTGGFSLPTLYNLVYCSRAAAGIGPTALYRVVTVAQRRLLLQLDHTGLGGSGES